MKIRHPRDAPVAIDVDGETVTPDDDGHYNIGDRRGWLDRYAAANDCDPDDLIVDATPTCDTIKTDGEVCGRELPCPYHSESED
jgi:hypothetical protein